MDDDLFDALRGQIDHDIDADRTGKMGIAMGFGLAGEFLRRGMLKRVHFTVLFDWESRIYRDRHVYPDPMMDDFEFRVGQPSCAPRA